MTKYFPTTSGIRNHSGITLIELVITTAIIGIIASVAVPSYGNYVTKTKVTEAAQLNHRVRVAMEQYHMKHGKFVTSYSDTADRNAAIGLNDPTSYASDVITKMWVGSKGVKGKDSTSGHIAITIDSGLGVSDANRPMLLSTIEYKNGGYEFICGNKSAKWKSNIDHEYLPASCQN